MRRANKQKATILCGERSLREDARKREIDSLIGKILSIGWKVGGGKISCNQVLKLKFCLGEIPSFEIKILFRNFLCQTK